MHFDLVDIRLLINIAEVRSLTRGAERTFLSLPAASTRIKNLEENLGAQLLYRNSQGVTLTPLGQKVLEHWLVLQQQIERLKGDIQNFTSGVKGHLRVLANTTAMTEFLPAVLRTYLVNYPDVNVDLQERLSPDIIRAVADGAVDIGLVAGSVQSDALQVLPYRNDRLVVATALSHPLARFDSVEFVQTLSYDFINLPEASAIHGFLKKSSDSLGRKLNVRIQVSNFETACRMIEANIGIGIMPEITAMRHAQTLSLRIVRLEDEWAVRNLQIVVRDIDLLPRFARMLVDLLVADGLDNLD